MSARYWVFVGQHGTRVILHVGTCRDCNNGHGTQHSAHLRTRWLGRPGEGGGFTSVAEARAAADAAGVRGVLRACKKCGAA